MKSLLHPILHLLNVIILIFYVFAQIGIFMFGGKVRRGLPEVFDPNSGIPPNYYLNNFNDLLSSYVTLFSLMVVNNWFYTVDMFVFIMDGNVYYRIFFYVFYYVAVIVGVNLVIAYTIDMYTSI